MAGAEVIRQVPWPFFGGSFPAHLGAVIQKTVLSGELPALLVIHDADNDWAVGDGVNDPNEPGASVVSHITHAIERNSSIATLADLPLGWQVAKGRAQSGCDHLTSTTSSGTIGAAPRRFAARDRLPKQDGERSAPNTSPREPSRPPRRAG